MLPHQPTTNLSEQPTSEGPGQGAAAHPSQPTLQGQPTTQFPVHQVGHLQEKPAFVWKEFLLGFGIPMLLMLVPVIGGLVSIGQFSPNSWQEVEVILEGGNGTEYSANFTPLGEDRVVQGCGIQGSRNVYFSCEWQETGEPLRKFAIISYYYNATIDRQVETQIGQFDIDNGTVTLDDGNDHGESLILYFDHVNRDWWESEHSTTLDGVAELSINACYLGLFSSLGLMAAGFVSGRRSMRIGAACSLLFFPISAVFGFAFGLSSMW